MLAAFAALALALAALPLLQTGDARGQSTSERLDNVRDRQDKLSARIQVSNGKIDELLGDVTQVRERESAVGAELASREAELEEAAAELDAGRERLEELRVELRKSSREMSEMLVAMYKSDGKDVAGLLLDAEDFESLATQVEYLQRIEDYQSSVITRTRSLRDENEQLVEELADTRDRIEVARDAIAQRRDQLASSRAALESQQAQLTAARGERRAILGDLGEREENLQEALRQPPEDTLTPIQPPAAGEAPPPVPGATAKIGLNGDAVPPAGAPAAVRAVIAAGNKINDRPYLWGGGHGSFEDSGYDCSGAVSYALHGGGLLDSPLDSTGLMFWGEGGGGKWITVYAHSGHAYVVVAGLRFDTSGTGGSGPRWQTAPRSSAGFVARHPPGL